MELERFMAKKIKMERRPPKNENINTFLPKKSECKTTSHFQNSRMDDELRLRRAHLY